MASIFANEDAPCGVFSPTDFAADTYQTIQFQRGYRSQNSAGEIETVYRPLTTMTFDAQPKPAGLVREIHGIVFNVKWVLFHAGVTPLQDADRCYIHGQQLEITQIFQYGTFSTEIELGYIGR